MKITRKFLTGIAIAAIAAIAALGLTACANTGTPESGSDGDPLKVYATTGYLADAVANLAPMPK
ncbi:hypothetical protein M3C74_05830 [Micrococcus lylae]|uniref:hypothetical protein n=1 Tax=Micrococcus lylae TaxID=1273 RepID=UPI000A5A4B41|nr:hypothetical protein [Micrococcus lylae]MCT2007600.1 hypothetical protein [Micrococcus lylae]MCT2071353.1 hypothetical protein [Micrococcus lylae]WIK81857.1 hypothetical protein CJ228_009680 [Micrococcus lylae]